MTKKVKIVPRTVEEFSFIVREMADHRPGDSIKAAIRSAARRLDLSYSRARTLWYGRPCKILFDEGERICARYIEHCEQEAGRLERRAVELRARGLKLEGTINDIGVALAGQSELRVG